jgi:hypothetical protein
VVGKHFPQLSFLGILLGNEPVFEPKKRVYQRLLAGDQEEADELLEDLLVQQPLAEVYDTALIPALALAETHWHRGEVNDGKHKFIMESLKEMIQDRIDRQQEMQAQETTEETHEANGDTGVVDVINSPTLCILSLPARSEADEIAAMMLAQILETKRCIVQALSVTTLASEMVDLVEKRTADVVCISATPPGAMMHARYICKQVRRRFPTVKLVVGLWDVQGDLNKAKERIGCGATVVATMAEAHEQVRILIDQLVPPTEKQAPPDLGQVVHKAHPAHYPSNVDVRPAHERMPVANSVDSGIHAN